MTDELNRPGEDAWNDEVRAFYAAMQTLGDQDLLDVTRTQLNPDQLAAAWAIIRERESAKNKNPQ